MIRLDLFRPFRARGHKVKAYQHRGEPFDLKHYGVKTEVNDGDWLVIGTTGKIRRMDDVEFRKEFYPVEDED